MNEKSTLLFGVRCAILQALAINSVRAIFTPSSNTELREAVGWWISNNAWAIGNYGSIDTWNTGKITDMSSLFASFSTFNDDISRWNTSAVTDFQGMFYGASSFNVDIGAWNTAAVTDTQVMFHGASSFNQDIGAWNTAAVVDMKNMFYLNKSHL